MYAVLIVIGISIIIIYFVCNNVNSTQLQLFAAKPVYPLKVDSSYQAKAYIDKQYTNTTPSNYTIDKPQRDIKCLIDATLIIAIIFTVVTTFVIGFLFIMSKQHHWAEKMEKKKPLVCSIAVVSLLINIFNATMSVNSVYHWANNNTATRPLHNNYDSAVTSVVVAMFFVFDAFHLFIFCIIIPVTYWLHYNQEFKKDKLSTATTSNKQQETTRNRGNERTSLINSNEQNLSHEKYDELSTDTSENSGQSSIDKPILPWYVLLSFTIFGPVASVMAHSPYIIIGYINDGHHAGSMFIYYMVVIGFAYSICWVGFYPQGFTQPKSSKAGEYKSTNKILGVAAILAFIGYFAIVTSITIFFVKIPINKSISDAPDQLAGIYKSGGFVIFSFVTYKMITFFYKSNKPTGIETAITEHKTPLKSEQSKWDTMSDDEKIKEVYDVVVDIISKYYENMNQK